jgi:hypothetical protein
MRTTLPLALAALALTGCAATYNMTVMPRDGGQRYTGVIHDEGRGEGAISVTIENKTYNGTWVQSTPDRTTAYVSGGLGWGRRAWGLGYVTMDNPAGVEAKALLNAQDGSGLRCDLKSDRGRGGGLCRDDKGREYDVQIRLAERR